MKKKPTIPCGEARWDDPPPETVADWANRDGIPGEVSLRDAEIAMRIVGLLLGRPFDERHAIGPARIVSAFRRECEAAERVRVSIPYLKKKRGGQPRPHMGMRGPRPSKKTTYEFPK